MKTNILKRLLLAVLATAIPLAADANEPPGAYRQAVEHFTQGKHADAVRVFRQLADTGDAAAIDFLGFLYLEGKGVPRSPWIAHGYFMDAAAKGNDQACRNLGNIYFNGHAGQQDYAQAVHWWEEGARRGAYRAAFSLGQLLYTGDGVPTDRPRAMALWQQAAERAPKANSSPAIALAFAQIAEGKACTADAAKKKLQTLADAGDPRAADTIKYLNARDAGKKPFVEIAHIFQPWNYCGITSATMLLRWQGVNVSVFDVQQSCPDAVIRHGVHWRKLIAAAAKHGQRWKIEAYPYTDEGFAEAKAAALAELNAERPIIFDWLASDNGHTTILCGHDAATKEFFFRDPALPFPGIHVHSEAKLKKIWGTRGYIPDNETTHRPLIRIVE